MFVNDIDSAVSALNQQIDNLKFQAGSVIEPFQQFEKYPNPKDYNWSAFTQNSFGTHNLMSQYYFFNDNLRYGIGSYETTDLTKEKYDKGILHFEKTYEQWLEDCQSIIEKNKEIKEHNDLQVKRIYKMMETLGVREKYTEYGYRSTRARKKTTNTNKSGFVSDIERVVPKDNFDVYKRQIESKLKEIKSFGERKLKEAQERQAAKEKEEQQKQREQDLMFLRVKYTPDESDSDINDIIDAILERNKYLCLAYWLEKNRGDWTDGYSYAWNGINSFNIETDQDREIFDYLLELASESDGDIDGRIFRDCKWNYSVLYGMVDDEQLMKDFEKAKSIELEEMW